MIYYAPNTPMGKELWKWDHTTNETHPNDPLIHGMRPAEPQEYPKLLYRGYVTTPQGGVTYRDLRKAEDAADERKLRADGFGDLQDVAERAEREHTEIAKLAAERHYHERAMSPAAQREAAAADAASADHVASVPETPMRKGTK